MRTTLFSCRANGSWRCQVLADDQAAVAEVAYDPRGREVSVAGHAPAQDAVVVADGDTIYILRNGRQTKVSFARPRPE